MAMLKKIIVRSVDDEKKNETKTETKKTKETVVLVDTTPDKDFWFSGGFAVKNLAELQEKLLEIDEEQYDYHTKRDGNDFANWIRDVFGYPELAEKVAKSKTKKAAAKVLEKALEN